MSAERANGGRTSAAAWDKELDEIARLVGGLDDKGKTAAVTRLLGDVLQDDARQAAITVAVENVSDAAKEGAVARAISAAPTDATMAAVVGAVRDASDRQEQEMVARAVSAASPEAKEAAVIGAVRSAPGVNKENLAVAAMESLPTNAAREEVAKRFLEPSAQMTDEIWGTVIHAFKWVLWGATAALVVAIGIALIRPGENDQALIQILLTVFTTVAGIFAGFVSGRAFGASNPPSGR